MKTTKAPKVKPNGSIIFATEIRIVLITSNFTSNQNGKNLRTPLIMAIAKRMATKAAAAV